MDFDNISVENTVSDKKYSKGGSYEIYGDSA